MLSGSQVTTTSASRYLESEMCYKLRFDLKRKKARFPHKIVTHLTYI